MKKSCLMLFILAAALMLGACGGAGAPAQTLETDAAPARLKVGERGVCVLLATVSSEPLGAGRTLVRKGRVFLGCADGSLELLRVKPDGKKEMDASAWAQGLHDADGASWERA